MKQHLHTIPDAQRSTEALAADLAWRGIQFRPCTQQPPKEEFVPPAEDVGYWGRVNDEITELESSLK